MKIEVRKESHGYNTEPYKLYINEELVFETSSIEKLAQKASEYVKLRFRE